MTPKEALAKAFADGSATEGVKVRMADTEAQSRPGQNGKKRKKSKDCDEDLKRNALFGAVCKAHGLPEPVHEYQFHKTRKWRFDYLFDGWLAVEVQGGVWNNGHHSRGQSQIDDFEKYNEAVIYGYSVLFFTPQQMEDGSAFPVILRALDGESS